MLKFAFEHEKKSGTPNPWIITTSGNGNGSFIIHHANVYRMSLPQDGVPQQRPKGVFGLFRISCAACGKGRLKTMSGKHSSANAGYCRSCGVFVGFECAKKAGWKNWKRMCPSCGGRLRTNSLLFFGAYFGLALMLMGSLLVPMGMREIQRDNQEHARVDLAVSDTDLLVVGRTVKLEGNINETYNTLLSGANIGSGKYAYWQWSAHDFNLTCTNGTVRIRASLLDGSHGTSIIMGSDGYHGAYRNGSAITVIGIVVAGQPQPSVEPKYLAPNSGAFYTGYYTSGWLMMGFSFIFTPMFFIAFPAFIHRYRSHWRRLGNFHADARARPLGSVAEVHASEAKVGHASTGKAINSSSSGLTVEELTRRMKPD